MTETRVHIMEVARRQFFKTGYAGTSINAIVEATRFTKPTIYYHFKNKAELFASLCRMPMTAVLHIAGVRLTRTRPPTTRARARRSQADGWRPAGRS